MPVKDKKQEKMPSSSIEAVFLYYGILEAYEDVGKELIGSDVIEKHVIKKMGHYLNNFIPDFLIPNTDEELESRLLNLISKTKEKIIFAGTNPEQVTFTNEDVWELRAAIFGFETVFIELLGEYVIRDYVFSRIAEILSSYLPKSFTKGGSIQEKLQEFCNYLTDYKLVKFANFRIQFKKKNQNVRVRTNKCIFAQIHDSEAYKNSEIRFCPWGMIGSAIVANHFGKKSTIKDVQFVTRGTISDIYLQEGL